MNTLRNNNIQKQTILLNLFRVVDKYNEDAFMYQLEPDIREVDKNYLLGLCKWYHITDQRNLDFVIEKDNYKKWKAALVLIELSQKKLDCI